MAHRHYITKKITLVEVDPREGTLGISCLEGWRGLELDTKTK